LEITDAIPEEELPLEAAAEPEAEETEEFKPARRLRPEAVIAIIAVLSALILALTVVLWYELSGNGAGAVLSGTQLLLVPLSGVATSLPLWLYALGMRYDTPMTMTGMIMFISPTMIFVEGLLVYHETFDIIYAILFGFVWTGVVLFFASNLRQHKRLMAASEKVTNLS